MDSDEFDDDNASDTSIEEVTTQMAVDSGEAKLHEGLQVGHGVPPALPPEAETDTTATSDGEKPAVVDGGDAAPPKPRRLLPPTLRRLAEIVEASAADYCGDGPKTRLSFGVLRHNELITVDVAIAKCGEFLNRVGERTVDAELHDVQFMVGAAEAKNDPKVQSWGVMIESDEHVEDVLGVVERAGLPTPNAHFRSARGPKLVFLADREIDRETHRELATRLIFALPGGDFGSVRVAQLQRLPLCIREDRNDLVNFRALQANAEPFHADPTAIPFPIVVLNKLGAIGIDEEGRAQGRRFLADSKIATPQHGETKVLGNVCPIAVHEKDCTYTYASTDGSLSVRCLAGHRGEGSKYWSEFDLLELATGDAVVSSPARRFDPLRDLPPTPGTLEYVRHVLRGFDHHDEAIFLWKRHYARELIRGLEGGSLAKAIDHIDARLRGQGRVPALRMRYDVGRAELVSVDGDRLVAVGGPRGANVRSSAHEFKGTDLWRFVSPKEGKPPCPGWRVDAESFINKAVAGNRAFLGYLGIPVVTHYRVPVAFVQTSWTIDPESRSITGIEVNDRLGDGEEIDAVEFFTALWEKGRLPLATLADVKRFVALIAAPLLRGILPGHLGVWWFYGPPGSGKDYLCEMVRQIWEVVAAPGTRISFDFGNVPELELWRSMQTNAGSIFARAKEVGKRDLLDTIIRIAGTDRLQARGLGIPEIQIPNTFTVVADSAEAIPGRVEVSRRTLAIEVKPTEGVDDKGAVLAAVKAAAAMLLRNLKRRIEEKGSDWFITQKNLGKRPIVPVALSRLLDVELPTVEGEDLTELWDVVLDYVLSEDGKDEAGLQLRKTSMWLKASRALRTLPSYRFSHLVKTARKDPANEELFSPYHKKGHELAGRIVREAGIGGAGGYLAVEIRGSRYAYRREQQRFILMREAEYLERMAPSAATTDDKGDAIGLHDHEDDLPDSDRLPDVEGEQSNEDEAESTPRDSTDQKVNEPTPTSPGLSSIWNRLDESLPSGRSSVFDLQVDPKQGKKQ